MLRWVLIFLVVAIIAGVLGFTGIMGSAVWIARTISIVFIVLFLISLVMNMARGKKG